ncbi:MAG TPA: acetylglutamate kinase [Bryobacteraceae bacterium]|nr:acetylglutamate kinase [Bryobacteraceae bacterium]
MKVLIKLGGTLLDSAELRASLAAQIAAVERQGIAVTVVHGGGKQMTRFLEERGVSSHFVNGLRVTTPETMDAVLKVLAGSVNQELVTALIAAGARAVGLTGIDGGLVEAEQMDPALGMVGRVVRANPELLDLLVGHGFLPVVACVAGARDGRMYNVNADQMASACAAGWSANRLIFLTDIEGVLDASKRVQPTLTAEDCERLIRESVATGGMQAKLNAAVAAIEHGVDQVEIAPGAAPNVLGRLFADETMGTRIVRARERVVCHD